MVSPFSTPVLRYLDAVHAAPRPVGPTGLDALPTMVRERTVYRWQRSLGDGLSYFPSLSLSGLGLVHAHLLLEGASDRWLDLPVAFSACAVNRGLERPGLYLHCAVPMGHEAEFEGLVRSLAADGWCESWTLVVTGDSWQSLGRLAECVDAKGRFRGACEERAERARIFTDDGLLRSYPFVVPAVFEAPEERVSLQEVWRRAFSRLGPGVWRYLPRGTRRWPVNGKRYVRHARDLLVAAGLFRQNVIRYRPLLEHGLEAFVLVPAGTAAIVGALGRVCPVVEEARAADGRVLLRLTGDERFVYEWLRLSREAVGSFGVWVHDYRREDEGLRRARFQYEVLFDPVSGTWRFPVDEMLSSLRRPA